MNVEFIKLSDGTTAVTDESGRISKRETETSSEELLIENKIETIDESINETKKKVKDYEGCVFLSKHMLLFQPILVVGGSFFGYVLGDLIGLALVLSCSLIICVPGGIMCGIAYPIYKRKLKGFEGKLEHAEELKLKLESELAKEKEAAIQKESTPINEPISLAQQNEIEIPLINEELDNAYYDSINSNQKKLVLQHNPNKR